ncbi:hypothetical protein GCM10007148_10270 [Parvularcula lutaonensis]|nr:hypothetical protein GCM10007148_10270 [Parvularcula lutaonensis]
MTVGCTKFQQLVLSGGGTRCYWQGGFLHAVGNEIGLGSIERISAVSGGALTACGHVAHIGERILEKTLEVFERETSNLDPSSEEGGPTPHEEAYREIVEAVFDEPAIRSVAEGPEIEIVLTGLPEKLWDELSIAATFGLYLVDRLARGSTTKTLTKLAGIEEVRVSARKAARDGRLVDLVTTAARIPPVFDVDSWNGQHVIDGGSISDAPFPSEDKGNSLILLASDFRHVPHKEGRIFVMPSQTVPTDKIDFTDPTEVRDAWDLGQKDGLAFLEAWRMGPMDWQKVYTPS